MSLRTRLALVFVAATLVPLGATLWLTSFLLDQSLRLRPVDQISSLSRSLQKTGKEYYRQACEQLKADALAGRAKPKRVAKGDPIVEEFRAWRGEHEDEELKRQDAIAAFVENLHVEGIYELVEEVGPPS